jgi:hypothetical protein
MFAPPSMSVCEFLQQAPDPPELATVDQSMQFLEVCFGANNKTDVFYGHGQSITLLLNQKQESNLYRMNIIFKPCILSHG